MTLSTPDFGPGTGPAACTQTVPVGNVEPSTAAASPTNGSAASPATDGKTPDGMAPAVASALAAISDELLAGCYAREEAVAASRPPSSKPGTRLLRADRRPHRRADGRIDEIIAHVDAGCVVYGGSGPPWRYTGVLRRWWNRSTDRTFVPGPASE